MRWKRNPLSGNRGRLLNMKTHLFCLYVAFAHNDYEIYWSKKEYLGWCEQSSTISPWPSCLRVYLPHNTVLIPYLQWTFHVAVFHVYYIILLICDGLKGRICRCDASNLSTTIWLKLLKELSIQRNLTSSHFIWREQSFGWKDEFDTKATCFLHAMYLANIINFQGRAVTINRMTVSLWSFKHWWIPSDLYTTVFDAKCQCRCYSQLR